MGQLYIALILILTFTISGFLGAYLENTWNCPSWIAWIIGFIVGVCFLYKMTMDPLKRKVIKDLRALSDEALKNTVFRYDKGYFIQINEDDPAVKRFRELVELRDIDLLSKEWQGLSKRFSRLEWEAGHRGRPLILDYYCWYELDIDVLRKRMKKLKAK